MLFELPFCLTVWHRSASALIYNMLSAVWRTVGFRLKHASSQFVYALVSSCALHSCACRGSFQARMRLQRGNVSIHSAGTIVQNWSNPAKVRQCGFPLLLPLLLRCFSSRSAGLCCVHRWAERLLPAQCASPFLSSLRTPKPTHAGTHRVHAQFVDPGSKHGGDRIHRVHRATIESQHDTALGCVQEEAAWRCCGCERNCSELATGTAALQSTNALGRTIGCTIQRGVRKRCARIRRVM